MIKNIKRLLSNEIGKIRLRPTVFENYRKVSFNIASEVSYVYILRGQKLIKNAKMVHFGEFAVKQCYQTGQF